MEKSIEFLGPVLTLIALPLLFWPSLVLIIAIIKQARSQMILKPKHILAFIAVQVIWLIIIVSISYALVLKPLNIQP